MKTRLLFGACVVLSTILSPLAATAQGFPSKPIKIVVGVPPGGASDTLARGLASGLSKRLGQPVVIENRPGASWLVATTHVAAAPADGHTLLWTYSTPLSVLPFMYKKPLPYQAKRDLVGVSIMGALSSGLLVKAESPYRTAKDFIEAAKAKPGALTHGSTGAGQLYTLAMVMLARQTGINVLEIPFQGAAPVTQALLAGNIDASYLELGSTAQFVHSGKLRVLAVADDERLKSMPNVPTFREAGYPEHKIPPIWFGLVAPAKTPQAVKERINQAVNEELRSEAMQTLHATLNIKSMSGSPEYMDELIRQDIREWGGIAKQLGVTLD